jgi:NDP-sugar pyrophosphorylase family protein
VQLSADGRIASFKEKDREGEPGWINAGIYLLTRSLLSMIPPNHAVSLEKEIFPIWIGRGLYGYQNAGAFLDIGTPQAYADAHEFFSARTLGQAL